MTKEEFTTEFQPIMDKACKYAGSGMRTFTESELREFLESAFTFLTSEASRMIDFESVPFIRALMRVTKRHESAQMQAADLLPCFQEELTRTKQ